ncbi:MAG: ThuA domain-containing protein, partial [Bacteroidia bacterium]|nr:ThuA domain-containing protein [Bacteroidia bacterium]
MESSAKEPIKNPRFRIIAFYTGRNDKAHVSFVHEANKWFSQTASGLGFEYDSTSDWNNMNDSFLSDYDVVVFLDTRPDSASQRDAFRKFMENGGAFMGFHFSAFALTPSAYPQNWDWYHNQFIGAGQYSGNTWSPTSALLRVEERKHPATKKLPETFT